MAKRKVPLVIALAEAARRSVPNTSVVDALAGGAARAAALALGPLVEIDVPDEDAADPTVDDVAVTAPAPVRDVRLWPGDPDVVVRQKILAARRIFLGGGPAVEDTLAVSRSTLMNRRHALGLVPWPEDVRLEPGRHRVFPRR